MHYLPKIKVASTVCQRWQPYERADRSGCAALFTFYSGTCSLDGYRIGPRLVSLTSARQGRRTFLLTTYHFNPVETCLIRCWMSADSKVLNQCLVIFFLLKKECIVAATSDYLETVLVRHIYLVSKYGQRHFSNWQCCIIKSNFISKQWTQ